MEANLDPPADRGDCTVHFTTLGSYENAWHFALTFDALLAFGLPTLRRGVSADPSLADQRLWAAAPEGRTNPPHRVELALRVLQASVCSAFMLCHDPTRRIICVSYSGGI